MAAERRIEEGVKGASIVKMGECEEVSSKAWHWSVLPLKCR